MQVLAPDVTLWADGGGKARAAGPHPVHGSERVARLLIGGTRRVPVAEPSVRYLRINGEPGALVMSGGRPYLLVSLELGPGSDTVTGVYIITNPDKLSRIGDPPG
jgi:hypothetical protein